MISHSDLDLLNDLKAAHFKNKIVPQNVRKKLDDFKEKALDNGDNTAGLALYCVMLSYLPKKDIVHYGISGVFTRPINQAKNVMDWWNNEKKYDTSERVCVFNDVIFDNWMESMKEWQNKNKKVKTSAHVDDVIDTRAISWLDEADTGSETSDDDDDVIDTRVHTAAHATSWLDEVDTASETSDDDDDVIEAASESSESSSSDSETELSDSETESEPESASDGKPVNLEPPPDTSNFGDIDPVLAGLEPKQGGAAPDAHLQELKKKDDDILAGINEMLESAGLEKITQE